VIRLGEDSRDRLGVLLVASLAALLLFTGLGSPYLWQDEAQTALLSRSILSHGVPVGFDAGNSFSQELGVEYGEDGVWKWHTWLSFYLVAVSMAAFGADTLPARLPFAVCGLAVVILTGLTARDLWRDRRAAFAAMTLLSVSVPFLVLSRQCRYYALASLLSLAGLWAYTRLDRGGRRAPWALFASSTLLFHTHYVYAATLLVTVLLHAALFARQRLRATFVAAAGTTLLALPWIAWVATLRLGPDKTARFLELGDTAAHAWSYCAMIFQVLFAKGAFLAIPLVLALRRRLRGEPFFTASARTRNHVGLLVLYCTVTVVLLAVLSPLAYLRYLAPLLPPLFLLVGLFVGELLRVWPAVGVTVIVAFVALGSMRDFVHEITHDYDGPIEGIVRFLQEHARPGDSVAIVYGDLPVKFYTELRVLGGLTGEDLAPAREVEWIVPRRHTPAPVSRDVRKTLLRYVTEGRYRQHVLAEPDLAFENREDPRVRHFRTPRGRPPVVIWERLR
jgi:4-amino-4-deoxy-L-arabinose transferase-like glycosyltransferase